MTEPLAGVGEPMPFRILLDEAARRTRRHFRQLFPAVAVPLALVYGAFGVLNVYWTRTAVGVGEAADPGAVFGMCGALILLLAVLILVQTLTYGAAGAAAVDAVAGRPVSMGLRWRFVLRPSVLFTLFGVSLAVGAGMIVCLFPGVYLLLLLGFVLPVMAEERRTLGDAFRRSSELARYNPQGRLGSSPMIKVLVLLFVGYVLSYVVSYLVQMPFTLAQMGLMFRDVVAGRDPGETMLTSGWQWLQVPGVVLGGVASAAVLIYVSLGMALLYFDVRGRREGQDLEAALDAILAPAGPRTPGVAPDPAGPVG
jgi:hypothetical protein